jgi:hypothetical protein
MTDLPDFHIPHAEKIEWMIDTHGWATEPVAARTDLQPPRAGYVYTIGYPERSASPKSSSSASRRLRPTGCST